MPPAPGDHEARRRDVSAAVWRVLADRGFGQLTLRAVAAEMGVSTGLLTHYFKNKRELVRYAHAVLEENTNIPLRPTVGLESLRACLLDILSLTPESLENNRVWVSFWDAAIGDPELGASETGRYERWRTKLRAHVQAASAAGELDSDVEDVAASAAALTHGIVVQALFDPDRFPPDRQIQLIDSFIQNLAKNQRTAPCPSTTDSARPRTSPPRRDSPTP